MATDMPEYLMLNIVTPNGLVYAHRAEIIVAQTVMGELGILPRHAPLITPLEIGEVRTKRVRPKDQTNWIAVNGGILEIRDNVCTIIADSAEHATDIDVPRAERAKTRAKARIQEAKEAKDTNELKRAEVALHRAINRIRVSKHLSN